MNTCAIVKEAKDANLLSQESKLTRVNLQLNLRHSKSTTPVLKRIFFQYLNVNLQPKGESAHAPVNGGPVFPGTILGYFGLIKHFLAEFLLFSIILYITLAL